MAAVGRNVTRFDVGERVHAATMPVPRGGSYAEYAVVEAEFVARVPDRLPTGQAGAMPWDALTALRGPDLLGLRPDETLMVFGASGGGYRAHGRAVGAAQRHPGAGRGLR